MIPAPRIRTLAVLFSLLLVSGCNHGSVGGFDGTAGLGSVPDGIGRFLMHDATADELLSFSVEVDGISVVYDDDTVSDNLLSAPFRVELLSLGEFSKWMAQSEFGTGTVAAIQISFTPFSYLARAHIDLVPDLGVHVTGDLAGTSGEPVLAADRILVRPGRLDRGQLISVDVDGAHLRVAGGEIIGSFGGAFLRSVVYDVIVESGATLMGEADGIVELAEVLAALESGEQLLVDIQGIGSDVAEGISAYQVLSFVE